MANGDAAAAAGITLVPPSSTGVNTPGKVRMGYDQMNRILDLVATWGIKVGTALAVARGGTGATTAAAAATNLNVVPWTAVAPKGTANAGGIARFSDAGRLQSVNPAAAADVATRGWVEQQGLGTSGTNLTLSGHLYVPNASPATSGYTAAYINSDGRLSRGASSRRFKKRIRRARRDEIAGVFDVQLSAYQLKLGDGTEHLGYIAEDLVGTPLERFIVRDAEGAPEGIDYLELVVAQARELRELNAELNARVFDLEARLTALEVPNG